MAQSLLRSAHGLQMTDLAFYHSEGGFFRDGRLQIYWRLDNITYLVH